MANSGDISQIFASQNMMFMGQNQWANQIGIAPPPFGAFGNAGGGFNYGSPHIGGNSYQTGNSFAGNAISGMGGAASLGGIGLGVAGMMGRLGPMAPLVDPFSAFGAARGLGMGVGGSLGAAMVPLGLGMLGAHTIGSFVGGAQQQQAVGNTLGQNFGFFNPMSRSGAGFSRQDSAAIGGVVREMSHLPELMSSMGELTSMIPKLRQMGVMQGVNNAAEFAKRFKESISTIKDTARILGTTMEDAATFFSQSRGAGFLGRNDQLKNALNVQLTSGMTGLTTGQVIQGQQAGAGLGTQMGGSRLAGSTAVTNIMQSIGLAEQQGVLKPGTLENVTGLQGPEAVQAGAQMLAQRMAQFAQSASGKLIMSASAKFDNKGNVSLDQNILDQIQSGSLSVADLNDRAQKLTEDQKKAFLDKLPTLSLEMTGKFGPGGVGKFFKNLGHGESGTRFLLQKHNFSEQESEMLMQMGDMTTENLFGSAAVLKGQEIALREKTDIKMIIKKFKTKMHAETFGHVEAMGASVQNSLAKSVESYLDDVLNRHVISLSDEGASAFTSAMMSKNSGDISRIFSERGDVPLSGASLSGRSGAIGEYHSARKMLGMTNSTDSVFMQGAGLLNKGIKLSGRAQQSSRSVAEMLQAIAAGSEGFTELSDTDKHSKFTSTLANVVDTSLHRHLKKEVVAFRVQRALSQGDAEGARRELESAGKGSADEVIQAMLTSSDPTVKHGGEVLQVAFAADQATPGVGGNMFSSAIAASQGNNWFRVNFQRLGSGGAAINMATVELRAKALKSAEKDLVKAGISPTTISLLKSSSNAKRLLLAAWGNSKVAAALMNGNNEEALLELQKENVMADIEDLDVAREALKNLFSAKGEVGNALGTFASALQGADTEVILKAFTDTGVQLMAAARDHADKLGSGLSNALTSAGAAFAEVSLQGLSGEERVAKFTAAVDATDKLYNAFGSATDEQRDVLGKTGLGRGFLEREASRKALSRLGPHATQEEIASTIGVAPGNVADLLGASDSSGRYALTESSIKKLASMDAMGSVASGMAGRGTAVTGRVADPLTEALTGITQNQKIMTTILASIANKGKIDPAYITQLTDSLREGAHP